MMEDEAKSVSAEILICQCDDPFSISHILVSFNFSQFNVAEVMRLPSLLVLSFFPSTYTDVYLHVFHAKFMVSLTA